MARTQAEDYDLRREAMIEQAASLFARTGFQGASVSQLAAACRTSKSLVYHYFPSKEDILYEVMTSHIDRLVAVAGEVISGKGDSRQRLERLIQSFMREYVGAADRQKVLLNELDNLPVDRRTIIVDKQRGLILSVQKLLAEIDPALKTRPGEAKVETMLIFGMINWMHTWFNPKGTVSVDRLAELVTSKLPGSPGLRGGKKKGPAILKRK